MNNRHIPIPLIRQRLTKITRSLRHSVIPDDASLSSPQSYKTDFIQFEGKRIVRKRIVLLTPGCTTATCTMCPLPNEALDRSKRNITPQNIINQFNEAMRGDTQSEMVTLYNNGNFFIDQEVSQEARKYIYKAMSKSKASVLVVESLPQFVTANKIYEAKKYLGDTRLAVAIGLQSSNDVVRELAVNTTCTKTAFRQAIRLLKSHGFIPMTFLMIKPPFLTDEESIEDTLNSIRYLAALDILDPILCPTRVAPGTIAQLLFENGEFRPPWLWTVLEIMRKSALIYPQSKPRVVTSELRPDFNKDSICAHNCMLCSKRIVSHIDRYNSTRNINLLETNCICREVYKKDLQNQVKMGSKTSLTKRVEKFVIEYEK